MTDPIVRLEAFPLAAPLPDNRSWGKDSWSFSPDGAWQTLSSDYPPAARRSFIYSDTFDSCLVRLESANGVVGWGETKAPVGAKAVAMIIDQLIGPLVVGADAADVRVLWDRMYTAMRVRGHVAGFWLEAISGVDIALWDLLGRQQGLPIHKLLGGRYRDRVRVYASGLPAIHDGRDPRQLEDLATIGRAFVDRGFKGMKMALGKSIEADVAAVEAVRHAVGPKIDIFVDVGGLYEPHQAMRLGRELERLSVGFLEMPIGTENLPGYARLAASLDIPIALDGLHTRFQVRDYAAAGAIDIVQPDVCRSGGITESLRMAEVGDLYGLGCAPHISIGTAIQFAATAQFAAVVPNLLVSEYWAGESPLCDAILREPWRQPVDGYMAISESPGHGLDIDEDKVRSFAMA